MPPRFRAGDMAGGFEAGTAAVIDDIARRHAAGLALLPAP